MTKFRKYIALPFKLLSQILFTLATLVGVISGIIHRGVPETTRRVGILKTHLETIKKEINV